MGKRTRVEVCVGALVVAAVVVYAVSDSAALDRLVYLGVLLGASAVAWVGALRSPAEHRRFGSLVAAGILLTALGDTAWELLAWQGRDTDVSVADPLWFASYVVLCAALWVLLRRSEVGRDAQALVLDAVTIVVVSILVFWNFSIHTIVNDQQLAPHVRVAWSVYPVADAVLLALVARVLMSRTARAHLEASFGIGVVLWLAADIAWLMSVEGDAVLLMDAAWMVAPVLLARSTWRSAESGVDRGPALPNGRMVQMGIAIVPLLVPPVLMLFADTRDELDHLVLVVVGATTLTLLAFVRTARLMRSEERALRELELARDAALDASRAKSMFLATMSHEIRTPLTMVLGTAELLEDTPLDEEQVHLLATMRRSGDHLTALVDDILDFSRIEAGQVSLTAERFDVAGVVTDLVGAYAPRAARAGIRFEHQVAPGVPTTMTGDRTRVLQVVRNLLDNAVKFTPEGGVRLDVRPAADAGGGVGAVEVAVSDTGIGIAEDDLATVFESFRQVDGSTTRPYGGSGLGLAICRQLVELMGGELDVTSRSGQGSTFVARLPVGPREDSRADPRESRTLAPTGGGGARRTP
ncbi:sensor histidine kinase [Nocardioides renjunii]|uniref:sensor histidine kinase n=1 Tax=Nocardioides renjunii TaxID=3095075 RepID=UPI002AFF4F4A|nr:ATP-binding protein [Nocardioides sp. S-34]WQQ22828.1 ATP-binding protein [Nocardioides sp. S-34]